MWMTGLRMRLAGLRCCGYTEQDKLAIKQLRKQMSVVMVFFLAMTPMHIVVEQHPGNALGAVVGLISGLSFTAIVVLAWRIALHSGDEYRRALLMQSLAWGMGLTVGLASVWGYLEIELRTLPRIPLLMVPVVLIFTTAMAKVLVFRREQVRDSAVV